MPPNKLEEPPLLALPADQPGADVTTNTGPRLPQDHLGRRLLWAGLISVLVNAALWRVASQVVRSHILAPPPPITFKRIFLPPKPKPPKKIVRKVVPPKPKPKSVIPHQIVRPKPAPVPRPVVRPQPAPPAAHHRILTVQGATPARQTAQPGGHAQLGQPIERQNSGEEVDNNQPPTPPAPTPPPPAPLPPNPPAPEPQKPAPPPPAPPAGPTQDAQPADQAYPEIPDELKTGDYKSSVRVKVEIAASGSFSVSLLTSSGNEEIDQRVLDALKRWKWKPALDNGKPVASTQRFRFDFEVH